MRYKFDPTYYQIRTDDGFIVLENVPARLSEHVLKALDFAYTEGMIAGEKVAQKD